MNTEGKRFFLFEEVSLRRLAALWIGLLGCGFGAAYAPLPLSLAEIEPTEGSVQILPVTAKAVIGDSEIYLEVARTPEQKARGLMFRPELPGDRGMLFPVEPEQPVRFWMKDVQTPLDMMFIRDGVIRRVVHRAPPCSDSESFCPRFSSGGSVDQVIEVKGGLTQERGLGEGDSVEIVMVNEGTTTKKGPSR